MNRFERHRVKTEKPETSTSHNSSAQDYDLTYYIHDRVELMHQVFSVLKHKDLKAMAPECVRHISIDDLQELCTEELLGISSKRLCAILDGAEPPSDTESSSESPERFETISLDSISSDEEILSVGSSKKNKKHKRHHRDSKTKSKKSKKSKDPPQTNTADTGTEEQSRASRAGLTVLELLELQARARAIRAQLQQEQAHKQTAAVESVASSHHSSDNEVEIKEEPSEVVEISSEDEKPNVEQLREKPTSTQDPPQDSQTVTKRINDLIITVPQTKQSRKIKLNRSKITVSVPNTEKTVIVVNSDANTSSETVSSETPKAKENKQEAKKQTDNENQKAAAKVKEKMKKKQKKKKKVEEEKDSDHDEITLQLSDTEKMDLLEDLDRKNFENVSSSGSEDSESSSSDSSSDDEKEDIKERLDIGKDKAKIEKEKDVDLNKSDDSCKEVTNKEINDTVNKTKENPAKSSTEVAGNDKSQKMSDAVAATNEEACIIVDDVTKSTPNIGNSNTTDHNEKPDKPPENAEQNKEATETKSPEKNVEVVTIDDIPVLDDASDASVLAKPKSPVNDVSKDTGDAQKNKPSESNGSQDSANEKEMSDGEISDKESSEVEAFDLKPEVVCISDTEETDSKKKKSKKEKKKKEKKSKNKKSKKSKSDFQESADQNFFEKRIDLVDEDKVKDVPENDKREETVVTISIDENVEESEDKGEEIAVDVTNEAESEPDVVIKCEDTTSNTLTLDDDYDDVYEILELSDDSSCYEVEGTVLSKEPTAEEIEALSAKIDEIEREDVVTEEEIRQHERQEKGIENDEDLENISWKDRYLDSKKVKRVLTTSNIFNALRKKNRELKKKLEESKKKEEPVESPHDKTEENIAPSLEEGSIEHYNMLEGSTKYVDPVPEPAKAEESKESGENEENQLNGESQIEKSGEGGENESKETPAMVKEMRRDAKQLLKMYKKLLKYNDINKKKDPSKKKKKKSKKKNKDGGLVAGSA